MARVAYEVGSRRQPIPRHPHPFTPVIADDGEHAWVAVVAFAHPPALGDRFAFRGQTWEIIREKDFLRGCVARPVAPRICAQ